MDKLTDQSLYDTGAVPPPTNSVGFATNDAPVTTMPCGHVDSTNFLSQLTHTGFTVRMPLPFLADTGPVPIFAFRIDPLAWVPAARDLAGSIDKETNLFSKIKNTQWLNCIPFNGSKVILNGCESPQSLFARAARFRRYNMTYAIRFSYQFSGTGLFMVVPYKGLPHNQLPLEANYEGGPLVAARMFNSYAIADGSRTREIKFNVPWEFPYKYKDLVLDLYCRNSSNVANRYPMYQENWFVVFARGSFVAPDNLSYIDMMIDHALTDYEYVTPFLCHPGMFRGSNPVLYKVDNEGTKGRLYFEYTDGDIRPILPPEFSEEADQEEEPGARQEAMKVE